ncbi:MAG: hypothetical protein KF819_26705 [Labilithrix sp.]|nr:hypothetical protein [Labilithrix sp.]
MVSKLVGLVACALVLPLACTEHVVIRQKATPPDGPPQDESADGEKERVLLPRESPDRLVVDLGEVQAGVDVPFVVPEGALGFNVVMEGDARDFDQRRPYGVERIVDPNGKTVHARFTPVGGTTVTSTAVFDTIAAASVPQSEAVADLLPPGTWKVRFGVDKDPSATPKVKAKVRIQSSGDGAFHGGELELHIHVPIGLVVGGAKVDPSKAATNGKIAERVDLFFALTSQLLGIERGDVVFHAAPAKLAEIDEQELAEGFAVSSGARDGTRALHVLFTNRLLEQGDVVAAGISPGIPGAATVFGRGVSGIIIATFSSRDEDVLTMLHESGHFFGLNHTSELDGASFDPLADTPKCEAIAEADLDRCPDRSNVMFPAGAAGGAPTLSPTQKRIYRGSPIYTAFAADGKRHTAPVVEPPTLRRRFRTSDRPLSPVERELSLGYCGLTPLDPNGLVARHGDAIAQLRAAAGDVDLSPVIRGRARIALAKLGAGR